MPDLTHAHWHKSSYSNSNGGDCVEVATNLPDLVLVRDSKDPEGPALPFPRATWTAFLATLRPPTPLVA